MDAKQLIRLVPNNRPITFLGTSRRLIFLNTSIINSNKIRTIGKCMIKGWNLPKKKTSSEVGSSCGPIKGNNKTAIARNKKTNLFLRQIFFSLVIRGFERIMNYG
jgi:hypothetical protein